jgi:hypothetical protein
MMDKHLINKTAREEKWVVQEKNQSSEIDMRDKAEK